MAYPEPLEQLIEAFERFPGIGRRSAERLAFHVIRDRESQKLAGAIERAAAHTLQCRRCCNVADADPCGLCSDARRDGRTILVVEEPRDVEAVERSGAYRGLYHVLMGALNPAEGTEEKHLTLPGLVARVQRGGIEEVILGTDPDAEGEATGLLVVQELDRAGARVRVTRLARGLPAGSALQYLHRGVFDDALANRVALRSGAP